MPHKHKRRRDDADATNRDLPPNAVATPLPAGKQSNTLSNKRKRAVVLQDDTPKAFARIMQFQKTGKRLNGLDNGEKPPKKRKQNKQAMEKAEIAIAQPDDKDSAGALKIKPGESMSAFSARVNQAIPMSGVSQKGKKIEGAKQYRTKLEKKITKRQDEWRKNEEKRKEVEAEAQDRALEEEEDQAPDYWGTSSGRRSKRKRRQGATDAAYDDPWEVLKEAREKPKGVFDVVQAPPTFKKLPTEKFKVKNGAKVNVADVPVASGSLRQREELNDTRKDIIDSYRRLMDAKRDNAVAA